MKKRAQGATEYILILAVAIVVVAVAIAILLSTAPGAVAPTISANAEDITDNTTHIRLVVTRVNPTVAQADWKYAVWWENEPQPSWADSPGDLKAETYGLAINGTHTGSGTYNVWLYHVSTKSVFFKDTVQKA